MSEKKREYYIQRIENALKSDDMSICHEVFFTEDAIRDILELLKAEPERKTAEWIYGENGGQDGWYCSQCGLFIPWDYEYYGLDNIDFIADFHTCPKCDRKMLKYTGMRGEQDE